MRIGPVERGILLSCYPDRSWTPPAIYMVSPLYVPCRGPRHYVLQHLVDKELIEIAHETFGPGDFQLLSTFTLPGISHATWASAIRLTPAGVTAAVARRDGRLP